MQNLKTLSIMMLSNIMLFALILNNPIAFFNSMINNLGKINETLIIEELSAITGVFTIVTNLFCFVTITQMLICCVIVFSNEENRTKVKNNKYIMEFSSIKNFSNITFAILVSVLSTIIISYTNTYFYIKHFINDISLEFMIIIEMAWTMAFTTTFIYKKVIKLYNESSETILFAIVKKQK